jgi:hypothetical protein
MRIRRLVTLSPATDIDQAGLCMTDRLWKLLVDPFDTVPAHLGFARRQAGGPTLLVSRKNVRHNAIQPWFGIFKS